MGKFYTPNNWWDVSTLNSSVREILRADYRPRWKSNKHPSQASIILDFVCSALSDLEVVMRRDIDIALHDIYEMNRHAPNGSAEKLLCELCGALIGDLANFGSEHKDILMDEACRILYGHVVNEEYLRCMASHLCDILSTTLGVSSIRSYFTNIYRDLGRYEVPAADALLARMLTKASCFEKLVDHYTDGENAILSYVPIHLNIAVQDKPKLPVPVVPDRSRWWETITTSYEDEYWAQDMFNKSYKDLPEDFRLLYKYIAFLCHSHGMMISRNSAKRLFGTELPWIQHFMIGAFADSKPYGAASTCCIIENGENFYKSYVSEGFGIDAFTAMSTHAKLVDRVDLSAHIHKLIQKAYESQDVNVFYEIEIILAILCGTDAVEKLYSFAPIDCIEIASETPLRFSIKFK